MADLEQTKADAVELIDEETEAASSLHPAARSTKDPKALDASKVGMMQQMVGLMSGMNKQDLTDWFAKTIAQFGPDKMPGAVDNSDKNHASIDMKPSHASINVGPKTKYPMPKLGVREDVEQMFAGEELSEEFKDKATTLFEAAINARLVIEQARLEEAFEAKLEEEVAEITEELVSGIDSYLDYVVEKWMGENEVAVESALRNEVMEDFIEGLKGLFSEHYINMPQEKIDVVESLADKVETLESKLDETIKENTELRRGLIESSAREVFSALKEGLTLPQQEKFAALAEGIDFDGDVDAYSRKLDMIRNTYFSGKKVESNIMTESFEEEEQPKSTPSSDPSVNIYAQAISRTVKK